jgi:hypothetical protein
VNTGGKCLIESAPKWPGHAFGGCFGGCSLGLVFLLGVWLGGALAKRHIYGARLPLPRGYL